MAGAALAFAGCQGTQTYDYTHLPPGYHWRAVYDASTNSIVFYGRDPLTLQTVYVGPDSRFYLIRHGGTIAPQDLKVPWTPHDATKL